MTIKTAQLYAFASLVCGGLIGTGIVLTAEGRDPAFIWLSILGVVIYVFLLCVIHDDWDMK